MTDHWTRVAGEKRFSHPLDLPRLRALLPPDARVLDLGCGYGRSLAELRAAGWTRLVGVDTAEGMIERGRTLHPELDLRHVPPGPLPLDDASFDAVLLFAVLTCVPEDAGQRSLVREAWRVLSPGGLLHVSDLLLQEDERNRARYAAARAEFGTPGVFRHPDGVVLRHHEPAWVDALLAPFEHVAGREVDVTTMNGNTARAFQVLVRRPAPGRRTRRPEPKPAGLRPPYGAQWRDGAMVAAYPTRAPYPDELFPFLAAIAGGGRARVLDLGAGTGDVARRLAPHVGRVDAIDASPEMVALGRTLPGGNAPNLRWTVAAAETAPLDGPYDLAVAAESLHWMEWDEVVPRVVGALLPHAVLALVKRLDEEAPWVGAWKSHVPEFSTNRDFRPFSLEEELLRRGLFGVHGRRRLAPVPFEQTVEAYVESVHSRNGFSRDRMDATRAAEFDARVREAVAPHARDGRLRWDVAALVRWGR